MMTAFQVDSHFAKGKLGDLRVFDASLSHLVGKTSILDQVLRGQEHRAPSHSPGSHSALFRDDANNNLLRNRRDIAMMGDRKSDAMQMQCSGKLSPNSIADYVPSKGKRDPITHRITEKQRRDKMNTSLSDLSQLLPATFLSRKSGGRIEKVDIVLMTIEYINELLDHLKDSDKRSEDLLSHGVFMGASETLKFLQDTESRPTDIAENEGRRKGLQSHLLGFISKNTPRVPQLPMSKEPVVLNDVDDSQSWLPKRGPPSVKPESPWSRKVSDSTSDSWPDKETSVTVNSSGSKSPNSTITRDTSANCYKKKIKDRFMSSQIHNESFDDEIPEKRQRVGSFDSSPSPSPRNASPSSLPDTNLDMNCVTDLSHDLMAKPFASGLSEVKRPRKDSDNKSPGFLLHPNGTYYIPALFDAAVATRLAQNSTAPFQALHPINIPVAYSTISISMT